MFKLRFVYKCMYRYIWKFAGTYNSMYGLARANVKRLYLLVSLCFCKRLMGCVYALVRIESRDETMVLPPEHISPSIKFSSQALIRDDSSCRVQVLPSARYCIQSLLGEGSWFWHICGR